jgi:hypothetical protein
LIVEMLRRLVLAAGVVSALSVPAQATAQPSQATAATAASQDDAREQSRAAFRRGVAQAEAGDYPAARDSFLEAYTLFPHPSILLNLAIARAHTGQWLEAEQDLVHFLADDGGAQANELASARAELAQTRSHLGTFRLRVSPDGARATLDGRGIALMPGAFVDVRATRGTHTLRVEADGYTISSRAVVVAGDYAQDVSVELAPATVATRDTTPTDQHANGDRATLGWFLVGAGAVAAAVGVYAGAEAISKANAYNTPNSGSFQDAGTKQSGLVFRTAADVAFVGALALGGVGLYFLVTPSGRTSAQARLVVGPLGAGVMGRF